MQIRKGRERAPLQSHELHPDRQWWNRYTDHIARFYSLEVLEKSLRPHVERDRLKRETSPPVWTGGPLFFRAANGGSLFRAACPLELSSSKQNSLKNSGGCKAH